MAEEAKTEESVTQAQENETQPETNISVSDLRTVVNLIDAGSQRGAWKGEELALIGALRNKFASVVQAISPQPEQSEEATDTGKEEEKEEK